MDESRTRALEDAFRNQRGRLHSLAYRLTGTREDAEDAVQEGFARLAARNTACVGPDLERLLVRVVTNVAIDALRRRRRRGYIGVWLPEPIPTADTADTGDQARPDPGPEARYDLRESALLAFQLALEALKPRQRAVLVLGDVFGMSAVEVGDALGLSPGAVRVARHRARRALADYDARRVPWTPERFERHRAALLAFLEAVQKGDEDALAALLADRVETRTDSNGEFTALRVPLTGRVRVARLYLMAAQHRREAGLSIRFTELNHLPAASIRLERPSRSQAPRTLMSVVLDADDRITQVMAILARRKLARFTES